LRSISAGPCGCVSNEKGFSQELNANSQILDDKEDPVLLLDSGLVVIHANAAATSLLDRGDGLRLRHRRLVARHPDDEARLQAVLCPTPRLGQPAPKDFAVVRRPERRPLLVNALPRAPSGANGPLVEAGWLIRISDPERRRKPDLAVLQRLFGLTPAEAAVVSEMLPPRSEAAAARRRGVARATFRTQLHAAYGKLGVNGRDELVHLLASYGFR
jgi:DNA-binding CsgD family transcriptional regulator